MPENFESFVQQERERLGKAREQAEGKAREAREEIASIEGELRAIEAYEAAKRGKGSSQSRQTRRSGGGQRQARSGSKRQALLQLIGSNPDGLTRGEILERMGLKGNKSGEMSVSNALTALAKTSQVSREGGRYRPA